jgi:hypothetical protein
MGLELQDQTLRQGVCLGLCEVIEHSTRGYVDLYLESFIPAVRMALCDHNAVVRKSAARAFAMLQRSAGPTVVETIVQELLEALEDEDEAETALAGLQEILSHRGGAILSFVVPYLIETPIEPARANALSALAGVAGGNLTPYIDDIIEALIDELYDDEEGELVPHVGAAAKAVMEASDLIPPVITCRIVTGIQQTGDHLLVITHGIGMGIQTGDHLLVITHGIGMGGGA